MGENDPRRHIPALVATWRTSPGGNQTHLVLNESYARRFRLVFAYIDVIHLSPPGAGTASCGYPPDV